MKKICNKCGKITDLDELYAGYWLPKDVMYFLCKECSAEHDKESMIKKGTAVMYLTKDNRVTNGMGSLSFDACVFEGKHNWWHVKQHYAYFWGPDNKKWYGRCVTGGWSNVIRCRRIKQGHVFAESWYARNKPNSRSSEEEN